LNPASQYATDVNLRARQRLWEQQQPRFDIVGWVLDVAGLGAPSDQLVLDVGCGNGMYLRELGRRNIAAVGCDRSAGMLASARPHPRLVNGDAASLPFRDEWREEHEVVGPAGRSCGAEGDAYMGDAGPAEA
jgi:SAM-dependent methyltransferase